MRPSSKFIQTDKITKQQWQIRLSLQYTKFFGHFICKSSANCLLMFMNYLIIFEVFGLNLCLAQISCTFIMNSTNDNSFFISGFSVGFFFFISRLSKTPSVHIKCWGRLSESRQFNGFCPDLCGRFDNSKKIVPKIKKPSYVYSIATNRNFGTQYLNKCVLFHNYAPKYAISFHKYSFQPIFTLGPYKWQIKCHFNICENIVNK